MPLYLCISDGNKEEDKVFLKLASSCGLVLKVKPTVKTIFQAPFIWIKAWNKICGKL